jgi:hypothetical protein
MAVDEADRRRCAFLFLDRAHKSPLHGPRITLYRTTVMATLTDRSAGPAGNESPRMSSILSFPVDMSSVPSPDSSRSCMSAMRDKFSS